MSIYIVNIEDSFREKDFLKKMLTLNLKPKRIKANEVLSKKDYLENILIKGDSTISPTLLFGKIKDFPTANSLRKKLWTRL